MEQSPSTRDPTQSVNVERDRRYRHRASFNLSQPHPGHLTYSKNQLLWPLSTLCYWQPVDHSRHRPRHPLVEMMIVPDGTAEANATFILNIILRYGALVL